MKLKLKKGLIDMLEKGAIIAILGVLAIPLEAILGVNSTILTLLLIAMGLDIFTGILKGLYIKQLSSKIGYKGFIRKIGIFAAVAVAHVLDQVLGNTDGTFRELTIIFYISLEALSIVENLASMDILIPKFIKEKLQQVNKSMDDGEKEPMISSNVSLEVVSDEKGEAAIKIIDEKPTQQGEV